MRLVLATHPGSQFAPETTNRFVRYGASPRGAQALMLFGKVRALLAGRYNLAFEDIAAAAHACLRHRIILNFEGEAEGITTDAVIDDILKRVPRSAEQPPRLEPNDELERQVPSACRPLTRRVSSSTPIS